MLQFCRNLIFYPGFILIIAGWALTTFVSAPFTRLNTRLSICRSFARLYNGWLLICCGIRVSYSYEQELPAAQNYIIMANHESSWEAFNFAGLRRPAVIVVKRELMQLPGFGQALALIKPIVLQRENFIESTRRILEQGAERLRQGHNLVIFPQGLRSCLPKIDKFNPLAIRLSLATGYPILLIAHNSGERLPYLKYEQHPGKLNVLISAPLNPADYERQEFPRLVMAKMAAMLRATHTAPIELPE